MCATHFKKKALLPFESSVCLLTSSMSSISASRAKTTCACELLLLCDSSSWQSSQPPSQRLVSNFGTRRSVLKTARYRVLCLDHPLRLASRAYFTSLRKTQGFFLTIAVREKNVSLPLFTPPQRQTMRPWPTHANLLPSPSNYLEANL